MIRKHLGAVFIFFEAVMHTYLVVYLVLNRTNIPLILFTTFELSMFFYLIYENRKKKNELRGSP